MTTFAYPVTQRGADTNRASFNTTLKTRLRMETSISYTQTSSSAAAFTITPSNFVVPAGARVDNVVIDVIDAWNGAAALSGTTINIYAGTAVIGTGSLETAGRVTPTFTGAQLSVMASAFAADTTISFVVSVSGSVVPNAGRAAALIFLA